MAHPLVQCNPISVLQIKARQAPVMLSGQACFCSDTTLFWPVKLIPTDVTLVILNPDYTVKLFFPTKNKLNPSWLGICNPMFSLSTSEGNKHSSSTLGGLTMSAVSPYVFFR